MTAQVLLEALETLELQWLLGALGAQEATRWLPGLLRLPVDPGLAGDLGLPWFSGAPRLPGLPPSFQALSAPRAFR